MAEFLPLCDVLFNVISLAGYFCDVVFDVVLGYALFERERYIYFVFVMILVLFSLIMSQVVSLRWYLHKIHSKNTELTNSSTLTDSIDKKKPINSTSTISPNSSESIPYRFGRICVITLHCMQMGVLWRYAKLFVPVDLRYVKHEVRDLCMLRLVHAFCEAAPMLLLQLYILIGIQQEEALLMQPGIPLQTLGNQITPVIVHQPSIAQQKQLRTFKDLNTVSCALSLFSVCWALASFSKNVRVQNVHRLVLTWLGVIFQFFWRLGTVISRVAALIVYASVYKHWIFLVITLHWMSMFFWLISPKNVFHGERISRIRKTSLAGLIAFVYVFAYINLQEVNHRQKMVTFYIIMFLENSLLVFLWLIGIWSDRPDDWFMTPFLILLSFCAGMFFMLLYYRYFHVRRLGYEAGGRLPADNAKYTIDDGTTCISMDSNLNVCPKYPPPIPGVFNCRFNPVGSGATKRKKKKPTTFVPPPNLGISQASVDVNNGMPIDVNAGDVAPSGLMSIPFWRRPITRSQVGGSSENEGSAGSRVNIHQKLQEKKQKQLAELKIIEEEIKQGKLGGPGSSNTLGSSDDGRTSLPRQPIPRAKKHTNIEPQEWRSPSPEMCGTAPASSKMFNDLNVMSTSRNYDPIYNSFGLNSINIPALRKDSFVAMENTVRNMSPISSQISGAESNSLTRQIIPPRAKIPHNMPRNVFPATYRLNLPNVFTDRSLTQDCQISMGTRNVSSNPSRLTNVSPNKVLTHFENPHSSLFLDVKHPRQISGTYSMENTCADNLNLSFPYNVIPPPRSKLDSRSNIMQHQRTVTQISSEAHGNGLVQQQQRTNTQRQMQRARTPEILLSPHYLDNSRVYYDWMGRGPSYCAQNSNAKQHNAVSSGDENDIEGSVMGQNGHIIASDIDSQVSLPRSYTLPREFKYYRRNKTRKLIKNEHFINSTNSSDGDVDSCDDNESERQSHPSNRKSNNSQQRSRSTAINRNSPMLTPSQTAMATSSRSTASTKYHHKHMIGSVSATTSPVNVLGNYKEANSSSAQNLMNNMHLMAQSPMTRIATPNYLNIIPDDGDNNSSGHLNDQQISNLDLINGVESNNHSSISAQHRQVRVRGYANGKNMVRHETKL